ncbi:MAG: hypothetical protein JWR21_906 [Herminiimonas sp.]|nr:hypothetical protein [Herminiimonas sp.]
MKRPSFQFYPADWKNNSKLRRCSEAARGAWIDVLCLLHDSDEYGVCRWPLDELARAAGVPLKLLKELVAKDVLKGADIAARPYIYTPRHAGKDGEPVVLVAPGDGPCWYCSRFARDEWVRQRRGQATQFTPDRQPPKAGPMPPPMPPIGERQGDGPTSTSPSTTTSKDNPAGGGTSAVQLSIAMRKGGVQSQPADPRLIQLASQGVEPETVEAACAEAKQSKGDERISVGYVVAILERWAKESLDLKAKGASAPQKQAPWWLTDASIMAKGEELGLRPNPGEQSIQFKGRIQAAIDNGGKPPEPRPRQAVEIRDDARGAMPAGLDLKGMLKKREATA